MRRTPENNKKEAEVFSMRSLAAFVACVVALSCCSAANAVLITYDVADLGGNQFQYNYTVTNDGSITSNLSLFDVVFDPTLYDEASLTNVSDPALASEWDPIFLGSGIDVPAAFDVFALGSGLAVGESLAGLAVQFLWLGAGLPGSQSFQIYDAQTFELVGNGMTTLPPVTVPEPETLWLLAVGIVSLLAANRRRGA